MTRLRPFAPRPLDSRPSGRSATALRPRLRIAAAFATVLAVTTALSGCILLPPSIDAMPDPPTTPEPSGYSLEPLPQRTQEPTDDEPDDEPSSDERVQPDEPVTTTDETEADTGELYAGEPPITTDDYSPDAAVDHVLEPTRGTPRVEPGIALEPSDAGDEYLAGTEPTADGDLVLSTAGRVEMRAGNSSYTCSGTVINSESGLIVVTAAHCIWDDDTRDYFDEIRFVPGYEQGEEPFGTWTAEEWWVPEQYLEANYRWLDGANDNGWMGFDFGFFRVAPQDGRTLEDTVGGQGVTFTAETNGVLVAGYPGNDDFDAEVLRACVDEEVNYGAGGDPNYGIECEMGSGASGSAFISNLDPATGAGTIVGVYSNGGASGAYGPPLGITAWNGLQSLDG